MNKDEKMQRLAELQDRLENNDPICTLKTKAQMVRFMQAIMLSVQDKTT